MKRRFALFLSIVAGIACVTASAPSAKPIPCSAPEYRQFDFWVGAWTVRENGQLAGHNVVTREFDGCAVMEHWKGAEGGSGTSINAYDASSRSWHQTWIDKTGLLLKLDGSFHDGKMVLSGRRRARDGSGKIVVDRISWSARPDGTVRQLWEQSGDNGVHWKQAFDGIYSKQ